MGGKGQRIAFNSLFFGHQVFSQVDESFDARQNLAFFSLLATFDEQLPTYDTAHGSVSGDSQHLPPAIDRTILCEISVFPRSNSLLRQLDEMDMNTYNFDSTFAPFHTTFPLADHRFKPISCQPSTRQPSPQPSSHLE